MKAEDGNTTRVSVCSQTQHMLRKSPSFKVNLHTGEDQNHSVQYLHSVKHTKPGHEPYIVRFVTNFHNFVHHLSYMNPDGRKKLR